MKTLHLQLIIILGLVLLTDIIITATFLLIVPVRIWLHKIVVALSLVQC